MLQAIQTEQEIAKPYQSTAAVCIAAEVVKAIGKGCATFPRLGIDAKARNIVSLVAAGAWTEAALVLIDLEAPEWTVRRLEVDDGEWFCSLSRHPGLPAEFDETAEGRHRLLPMAILAALADARQQSSVGHTRPQATLPRMAVAGTTAWCDNVR